MRTYAVATAALRLRSRRAVPVITTAFGLWHPPRFAYPIGQGVTPLSRDSPTRPGLGATPRVSPPAPPAGAWVSSGQNVASPVLAAGRVPGRVRTSGQARFAGYPRSTGR